MHRSKKTDSSLTTKASEIMTLSILTSWRAFFFLPVNKFDDIIDPNTGVQTPAFQKPRFKIFFSQGFDLGKIIFEAKIFQMCVNDVVSLSPSHERFRFSSQQFLQYFSLAQGENYHSHFYPERDFSKM